MDQIDINQAVNKALKKLEKSGKVAKTTMSSRLTETLVTTIENEELGGVSIALVEGTLGLKLTDLEVMFTYYINGKWHYIGEHRYEPVKSPIWYGNLGLVGMGDDDGAPAVVCVDFDQNTSMFITRNPQEDITITSSIHYETIHPIDPKYLPGVCLPVVELSTEIPIGGTEVTLSTEEGTLLTKACESGIPVCLKIRLGIGENITTPISAVFVLGTEDANSALSCTLNGTLVMIKSKDSVWTATFG